MNAVFLDSVGMTAVWDVADQWHPAAETAYQELLSRGRRLGLTEAFTHDQHFQAAGFTTLL